MEENRMMEQALPAETVENAPQVTPAVETAAQLAAEPANQPAAPAVQPEGEPAAAASAAPAVLPEAAARTAVENAQPAESVLSHTAALEQELEQLRQEKRHRQLLDEASAQLTERGIDPAFAPFVLGEDSAATRKRVEQFDRQFASALRRHLAARMPAGEPKDFSVSRPLLRRRGIRPVGESRK